MRGLESSSTLAGLTESDRSLLLSASVSVIVPTFKEAENLPELLRRLENLRSELKALEIIVVDDNSNDGTEKIVLHEMARPGLRLLVRKTERGLSSAVIHGMQQATQEILIVMDADLSHPPEAIRQMALKILKGEADFVVGSRYCEGGSVDLEWTFFRRINSGVATFLARPFTQIQDPMAGFFCLKREAFLACDDLNPVGYKIALELIVKGDFQKIREIPITFADRYRGKSKLSWREQINYLRHIQRLWIYKFAGKFGGKWGAGKRSSKKSFCVNISPEKNK